MSGIYSLPPSLPYSSNPSLQNEAEKGDERPISELTREERKISFLEKKDKLEKLSESYIENGAKALGKGRVALAEEVYLLKLRKEYPDITERQFQSRFDTHKNDKAWVATMASAHLQLVGENHPNHCPKLADLTKEFVEKEKNLAEKINEFLGALPKDLAEQLLSDVAEDTMERCAVEQPGAEDDLHRLLAMFA